MNSQDLFNQLSYYTLSHKDPSFIHQYIVDAYTAQTVDESTKPIAITFALAGLYLHIEKGFTGKQVQLVHMNMAKRKTQWPSWKLPEFRGDITIKQILEALEGKKRDKMIEKWCISVWDAYKASHKEIAKFMEVHIAYNNY